MTDENDPLTEAHDALQDGRLDDAESLARQVLGQRPNTAAAWHIAGLAALQAGRPADAVADLARASEIDAENGMLWMHLGIGQ